MTNPSIPKWQTKQHHPPLRIDTYTSLQTRIDHLLRTIYTPAIKAAMSSTPLLFYLESIDRPTILAETTPRWR